MSQRSSGRAPSCFIFL